VREIERDVRLSGPQGVAFYELVTSSLKAADTLGSACPADTALTPVGRMETMRKRLAAVRAATAATRPALVRFYGALDQGQKRGCQPRDLSGPWRLDHFSHVNRVRNP
jgi:hypothetical protein